MTGDQTLSKRDKRSTKEEQPAAHAPNRERHHEPNLSEDEHKEMFNPRPQAQSSARSEAKTYFETQQTARYTIRLPGRVGTFHVRLRHLRARSCRPDDLRHPKCCVRCEPGKST